LAIDLGASDNKQMQIPNRNTTNPITSTILLNCENTPIMSANMMAEKPTLRTAFAAAL